ncbi:MAG: hypothetical protein IKR60_02250 [Alphaproteobacteria bacterium]|nr:hypothetical protein [Alphaproteobacteria bacterium]MBR6327679.1 hypothetical protein [Alphaproteobacteria bacterium]
MKKFEAVLCTLLTAGMAVSANAQENTEATQELVNPETVFAAKSQSVLFKIHDVKPVLNTDGAISSCSYTVTFFNRTKKAIRQAQIEFGWTDRVSDLYMIENSEQSPADILNDAPVAPADKKAAKDAVASSEIKSTVTLPSLGVLKQVSVQGYADTDKCFALLDDVNFKVKDCVLLTVDNSGDLKNDSANDQFNACAGLFAYVDSKNPEYYGEFKEVAYAELQDRAKTAEEQETEQIKNVGKAIEENITKTTEFLSSIE